MAEVGVEEVEYDSDPEEAKLSLKMRRREASDDEEDDGEGRSSDEGRETVVRRPALEGESEDEGGPAEYDEDGEEEYFEEDELDEEEGYEEEMGIREVETVGAVEGAGGYEAGRLDVLTVERVDEKGNNGVDTMGNDDDNHNNVQQHREGEKKENEPYAVPTAGAFYMHDDRFQDNAGGRNRRTFGGRKLWESKDERKWGHDKFEELTLHENQYEEGRRPSRGRFRGRGRGRAPFHGYYQGNRPKTYGNSDNRHDNNQNNAPKVVRGRGPRKYQPLFKNSNDGPHAQKQSGKYVEKPSHTSSAKASAPVLNGRKKQVSSNLNYASPPFYPSTSSSKEIMGDVPSGTINRNPQLPIADENFLMPPYKTTSRGKNIAHSIGIDKLYIDDSASGIAGKSSLTHFSHTASSSLNLSQSQHRRAQGRGLNSFPFVTYQPTDTNNQVSRVSRPTELRAFQQKSIQSLVQPSLRASGMQFAQRSGSVSLPSSPPKSSVALDSLECGDLESLVETSKSKTLLVNKGKMNVQGMGSTPYGGAQAIGPPGPVRTSQGDQNISGAPSFLPVMQFGGQHPGGVGVPAVGMAFPGYVGQPQLGNSEMTWLPVLAGAAGALGATYPYLALDGAYHPRSSAQGSTPNTSIENDMKAGTELKSLQRHEVANDDYVQRQKNPRRYTEMKFDQ